jgi:hypothetical protein
VGEGQALTARRYAWLAVPVAAAAYPLGVIAGGLPRFPTRADCVRPPAAGRELEAVFGRFERQTAAETLLAKVRRLGFSQSSIEDDGCGLLVVSVGGIPTVAVGRSLVAEARAAGLRPTLETAPPS